MANDDDDDFTFCSVAETEKVSDDINAIRIDDGNRNDVSTGNDKNSGIIWKVNGSIEKQGTVGSLSFRVIDASSRKEVNLLPKVAAQENDGSSMEQKKAPIRKAVARGKVPFEKGYSPMDWLKLTRTHPDLAGLKRQSNRRRITLAEVKQHQSGDSMWTVLKGRVYNIAPYLKFHPGDKYHAWVNEDFLLEKCLVGVLDSSQ